MMTDNPFEIGYVEPEEVDAPADAPKPKGRGVVIHKDLDQGSVEWLQARCGLLTASEMKLIITAKTLKSAADEKCRSHLYELLAQRITNYVEPRYFNDDMLRGQEDEILARAKYEEKTGSVVQTVGFITNDRFGFTLGYSPDGLIDEDGSLECKSRRQKFQVQTIVENIGIGLGETIPADFLIQHQTGLMVSEREWIDFTSYSGGLPMAIIRVWPDPAIQNAIEEASGAFERQLSEKLAIYRDAARDLIPTERTVEQEIF